MLKPDGGRPDYGDFNSRPQPIRPMRADENWRNQMWYEAPREDPEWPEVYVYTDEMSYAPGETVAFRASTTAKTWKLQIYRDGFKPKLAYSAEALPGQFTAAPKYAYKAGCDWPILHSWKIPEDTPSGFFRVVSTCLRQDGTPFVQHHFFIVRPTQGNRRGKFLMMLPTSTWTAYNDWGGASHYYGVDGPSGNRLSPILSMRRPWTRGMFWLPEGAPRIPIAPQPGPHGAPRYPNREWSYSNGFGYYYSSAGYAMYDRHFVLWAEREGYAFDMITQTDLHYRPEILDDYPCLVIVGHDEYWSHQMRTTVERFVDEGGHLARFAGNFLWQIRLEENGGRQVCYKDLAGAEDPVRDTADKHLLTAAWEDKRVGWPGATTVGVNGLGGIYASFGGFSPRGQRGFTIYRPAHWIFDGVDLHYGDLLGADAGIFGYEVDGLDYTFRRGLPYPTHSDGAPESVQILGMAPASKADCEQGGQGFRYSHGDKELRSLVHGLEGSSSPENMEKWRYGSGMLVHMTRGKGEVVTAGTCEWIMGLTRNDFYTQQITRNVIDRFCAG